MVMFECLLPLLASKGLVAEFLAIDSTSDDGWIIDRFLERATTAFTHAALDLGGLDCSFAAPSTFFKVPLLSGPELHTGNI